MTELYPKPIMNLSSEIIHNLLEESTTSDKTMHIVKKTPEIENKALIKNNELLWDICELGSEKLLTDLFKKAKDPSFQLDINSRLLDDYTALHLAASEGHSKIIEILLDNGANIEAYTTIKRRALHIASLRGSLDAAKVLISRGANVDAQDYEDHTPLHIASERGFGEIVELLLEKGADPKKKNIYKISPIDLSLNEETRRIYDKFLKEGEQYECKDFLAGVPRLSSRANFVSNMLYLQNVNATKENQNKTDDHNQDLDGEEKKDDVVRSQSIATGSKIMKIPMEKEKIEKIWISSFDILKRLGKGGFGEVLLARKKTNQKLYAMKILEKERLRNSNLIKYAHSERNILSIMDHPFIVKLNFAFQSESKLYLVMDYCPGGDLSHFLDRFKRVNEETARLYVCEVLLALEALHKNLIIFRDLKPDNVVLDEEGHALLTDFGLSKEGMKEHDFSTSFCGSVAYIAPEILEQRGHNRTLDWYLLGVFMYELLVGLPPYFNNDRNILFQNIRFGILRYPSWEISSVAKNLIEQLLCRDPKKRLGYLNDAEDIKKHPWFKDVNWDDVLNRRLKPPKISQQDSDGESFLEGSRFDKEKQILDALDSNKFFNWTFVGE